MLATAQETDLLVGYYFGTTSWKEAWRAFSRAGAVEAFDVLGEKLLSHRLFGPWKPSPQEQANADVHEAVEGCQGGAGMSWCRDEGIQDHVK